MEKRAIEVGNIFKLGTRFTEAFGFSYTDAAGEQKPVEMGCYGIGPSRIMGTLVEVFNDEKGIIWPASVAPFKLHLLTLGMDEAVKEKAEKLYHELISEGVEVLFDDRDESAGKKLNDADLIGIPLRIVMSKRSLENGGVELKRRSEADSQIIPLSELKNHL